MTNRLDGPCVGMLVRITLQTPTPVMMAVRTTAPAMSLHDRAAAVTERDGPARVPASPTHLSSAIKSAAVCHRSSGCFARHRLTIRSKTGGVIDCNSDIGLGSCPIMAAIKLAWLCPSNALFPVAISYTTAPKAKMSVLLSASLPSNCSGTGHAVVCSRSPSYRALR